MLWMTHVTLLAPHREGVEVLMADLQVPTDEFAYGRSKIFIRNPRTVENTDKHVFQPILTSAAHSDRSSRVWASQGLNPVCSAALFSHSKMFVKQGWAALGAPASAISMQPWKHMVPLSRRTWEMSFFTRRSQALRLLEPAAFEWTVLPTQQKTKQSLE